MPVQAIVLRRQFDGRAESPISLEAGDERLDPVLVDVEHDHLLLAVSRAPAAPCASTSVGEPGQHRAGDPADGRRDADVEPAVLLPVHADVVAGAPWATGGEGRRPARA